MEIFFEKYRNILEFNKNKYFVLINNKVLKKSNIKTELLSLMSYNGISCFLDVMVNNKYYDCVVYDNNKKLFCIIYVPDLYILSEKNVPVNMKKYREYVGTKIRSYIIIGFEDIEKFVNQIKYDLNELNTVEFF
jgi:hypothetical protein